MFESKTDYPCAVTSSDDAGLVAGFRWCQAHLSAQGRLTLWVHQKQTLGHNQRLAALSTAPSVRIVTGRGGGYVPGGVILAAYPDLADLGEIQRSSDRISALCVVAWNTDEIKPWVTAIKPEVLGDASAWADSEAELPIDPVVLEAMKGLTNSVGHGNTISGGFEKDMVVSTLLALRQHGYRLDGHLLQAWALANGWRGGNPKRLADYARDINAGKRPRARRVLREDYVRYLERKVSGQEDDE